MIEIVKKALEAFHKEEIVYCHWKSNMNLGLSVDGMTDLDMLFNTHAEERVTKALGKQGFILCKTAWFQDYPGIRDYISIDPKSGRIVHIHAHFGLIIGEKFIKSYDTDWGEIVLKNRTWDSDSNIYRSDYNDEIILLIVRECLKFSKSMIHYLRTKNPVFLSEAKVYDEYSWLNERIDKTEVYKKACELLDKKSANLILEITNVGLEENSMKELNRRIRTLLKNKRRYGKIISTIYREIRYTRLIVANIFKKFDFVNGLSSRRRMPIKGVIITILGADGAGKSTVSETVTNELKKKLDTSFFYLGSGKGKSSFIRKPLKLIYEHHVSRVNNSNKSLNPPVEKEVQERNTKSSLRKLLGNMYNILWALSLAYERKRKLRTIWRAKKRGWIIVTDRYPQTQIMDYNDGPKLGKFNFPGSSLLKKWEHNCYKLADKYKPDLVVKLFAEPKILKERRPEMSLEELINKQEGILSLTFNSDSKVIKVDSSKNLSQVLQEVYKNVNFSIMKNNSFF